MCRFEKKKKERKKRYSKIDIDIVSNICNRLSVNRYHYKEGPLSNPSSGSENSRSRKYDPRGYNVRSSPSSSSSSSFLPWSEAVPPRRWRETVPRELLKTNEPCDWIDNLWGTPWGIKYNGLIHVTDARSDPARMPTTTDYPSTRRIIKPQWRLVDTIPLRFLQTIDRVFVTRKISRRHALCLFLN